MSWCAIAAIYRQSGSMVVEVAQEHNETHDHLYISQHTPLPNSVLSMLLESINGENDSI